jgi:uncharacterized protein
MASARRLLAFWREALLVLLVAAPWLALLVLGLIWLWQGGHVWIWAIAAAMLGLIAWPLWRTVQRRANDHAKIALGDRADPSAGWNAVEREAWNDVLAMADATTPFSFTNTDSLMKVGRETVEAVARRMHPESQTAWAQFSLPEVLLLVERSSRDIRREALRHVPGIRSVKLSHLLWLRLQKERYGAAAQRGWQVGYGMWRIARGVLNPLQALAQEASGLALDKTARVLSLRMRAYLTRLFVLEIGRAAIDLYSGRLMLSDDELRSARESDRAEAESASVAPVRILLAGQVNAGKSSLVNALAGEVRCAIGPIPTTEKAAEFLLERDGQPVAIVVDMAGISAPDMHADVLRQAARADLIVWTAAATQPARHPDREALERLRAWSGAQQLRRPPPILLALTHVDQLRPASEWSPPYDIAKPATAKARAIRAAIDSVAAALAIPAHAVVPVAMPQGREPYNVDALWTRMLREFDEAKLVQLDRLRVGHSGISVRETLEQLGNTGRLIVKGLVQS